MHSDVGVESDDALVAGGVSRPSPWTGSELKRIEQDLDHLCYENTKSQTQMETLQQKLGDLQQQNEKKVAEIEPKVKAVQDTTSTRVGEVFYSY